MTDQLQRADADRTLSAAPAETDGVAAGGYPAPEHRACNSNTLNKAPCGEDFNLLLWGFCLCVFSARTKGVSTKSVSMKMPNFPYFRANYTEVSKGNFQKSP